MMQFVSVALRNSRQVGAICPSSPALCRALAHGIRTTPGPKRILEAGPGTGPVTKVILDALRPGDHLDIVELSPDFCQQLQHKVLNPWCARNPNVHVTLHQTAVQDAPLTNGSYDFIVCGLPFNNFAAPLVRQILDQFMRLLKRDGELAYFGYTGMRTLKMSVGTPKQRRNLQDISAHEGELLRRHRGHRQLVVANIPPASVYRLRKTQS